MTCKISDGSESAEKTLNLYVIGKVEVSIHPMTVTVLKGYTVDIYCRVVNSNLFNITIEWFREGVSFYESSCKYR